MPGTGNSDTESDETKYLQTTIGDLRKVYGVDFAKGCCDGEKVTDVVRTVGLVLIFTIFAFGYIAGWAIRDRKSRERRRRFAGF
jgi:hypothetical protein